MQTHLDSTNVTKTQIVSLIPILEQVPDPRVTATVDHDLPDILTIALCTILCGGDSSYDMGEFGEVWLDWLKTFLRLRNGAPTHDITFKGPMGKVLGGSAADVVERVGRIHAIPAEVLAMQIVGVAHLDHAGGMALYPVAAAAIDHFSGLDHRLGSRGSGGITIRGNSLAARIEKGC